MAEESRMIVVAERRAHIIDAGRGPPVILLHGLGGLAAEVIAPLLFLASSYRLIAVDRPGYGLSDPLPAADMAPDRQAEWLAQLLSRLSLQRPVLLAHSLAAATALCYAQAHPDRVSGLVLVSPFCRPTMPQAVPLLRLAVAPLVGWPVRKGLYPLLAFLLRRPRLAAAFRPNPVPLYMDRLPAQLAVRPEALLAMAAELNGYNRAMIPLALRLRRLRVRTVVLAGDEDRVAPWDRHAFWLARRLPDSAGACLKGTGHMAHHIRPAMVAAALESVRSGTGKTAPGRL